MQVIINKTTDIIISVLVNSGVQCFKMPLRLQAFLINLTSLSLFPIDKNNARKNGQIMSQGENGTSIIKKPEIVLIAKFIPIRITSTNMIFLRYKEYICVNINIVITDKRKQNGRFNAIAKENTKDNKAKNIASFIVIFPDANGLLDFSGCRLSFFKSTISLIM